MKQLIVIEAVIGKIYQIRGRKVFLDRDLAELYGVKIRILKQAVRPNIKRFLEDFMFLFSKEALARWRSQIVMSRSDKQGA